MTADITASQGGGSSPAAAIVSFPEQSAVDSCQQQHQQQRKRQRQHVAGTFAPSAQRRRCLTGDALVPGDRQLLCRAESSCGDLENLESQVPQQRGSSDALPQSDDSSQDGCDSLSAAKQPAAPLQHLQSQQASKPAASDAAFVERLGLQAGSQQAVPDADAAVWCNTAAFGGDNQVVPLKPQQSAQQTTLSQVAAFQRPFSRQSRVQQHVDITCGVDWSADGWHLATAGVRKSIRLYSLSAGLAADAGAPAGCKSEHRMAAKLSDLAWCPGTAAVVTTGDYDGDVCQVDLDSGHQIAEVQGHGGRRVWSVAHSQLRPNLCASAGDDGTAVLWAGAGLSGRAAPALRPADGAPITCVDFSLIDENALLLASADGCAYIYDLRNSSVFLQRLSGHSSAVSYARFCGSDGIATASIDNTLAFWSTSAFGNGVTSPSQVMRGHSNRRNFIGLSVLHAPAASGDDTNGGHILACGSEDGIAHVYNSTVQQPLATWSLQGSSSSSAKSQTGSNGAGEFVSAVAWAPASSAVSAAPLLAVAASDGDVRVLSLEQ